MTIVSDDNDVNDYNDNDYKNDNDNVDDVDDEDDDIMYHIVCCISHYIKWYTVNIKYHIMHSVWYGRSPTIWYWKMTFWG